MLYMNDRTHLLQERGHEKNSNCVAIDEPSRFRYNTHQFPLVSNSHLIKVMEDSTYTGKNELYICSPYNSNKIPNVEDYEIGLEWFSPDQKDKVIRVKVGINFQINISLNNFNGDVLQTASIYYYSEDLEIIPSQDGRYMLIYSKDNDDYDFDPKVNWKAYEIILKKAEEEEKDEEKVKNREKDENGFDKINSEETKEGNSEPKKDVFKVIEISSGTVEGDFDDVLFDEIKMAILNTGDVVAVHMETKTFMLNQENFYDRISGGLLNHSDGLRKNELTGGFQVALDDVKIGQSYVLMRFPRFLFSFRFRTDPGRSGFVHSFKRLNAPLITEYKGIDLDDIIITSHPNKVLLKYSFEEVQAAEKHNILIWDIEKDEEMSSFTSRDNDEFLFYMYSPIEEVNESILHRATTGDKYNKDPKLVRQLKAEAKQKEAKSRQQVYQEEEPEGGEGAGEGDQEEDHEDEPNEAEAEDRYRVSETGYLVFDKYYVNLDSMVPSPFMQFGGEILEREHYQFGPKMNFDESLAVVNGKAISAFSYLDIEFRSKRQIYHGNPSICKYFVNGKSIVSDYILEDEKLEKVLEFLEEDPIYLLMILTPDYKNKTPLDEAIENNSPKVVEMLLGSVLKLEGFKLSNSFKHRFLELFDMGVEAFRQYISLCYFRTGQMEFMKKMSTSSEGEIFRLPSQSSVLGNEFNGSFLKEKKKEVVETPELRRAKTIKETEADNAVNGGDDQSKDDEERDSETLESDLSLFEMGIQENLDYFEMFRKEVRIEVKGIEFDWILKSHDGEMFLEKLKKTDTLEYFEIDLIKDIIYFQWQYFLPRILLLIFAPFMIYFVSFILYSTWILDQKLNEEDDNGEWHVTALVMGI